MIIDKNRYSVPARHARLPVRSIIHADRVGIFHGAQRIALHRRIYGNNKWQLDPKRGKSTKKMRYFFDPI
jgi:hypothetical protein